MAVNLERAFPRIAKHLNYNREFLAPHIARVTTPGISYTSFDHTASTGVRPHLWGMLGLVESSRAFTFWPVPHADKPDSSFLDCHLLYQNSLFFITSAKLSIRPELYKLESPKFPLTITTELEYVGRTSKRFSYTLLHPSLSSPYAICEVEDVLVDAESRRPKPYPDWWMQKYAHLPTGTRTNRLELQNAGPEAILSSNYQIGLSDTDSNYHTNWTTYARIAYDSFSINVLKNAYRGISKTVLSSGPKRFEVAYTGESGVGDVLSIQSWVDSSNCNTVNFDIKSGLESTCKAVCEFFPPSELDSKI